MRIDELTGGWQAPPFRCQRRVLSKNEAMRVEQLLGAAFEELASDLFDSLRDIPAAMQFAERCWREDMQRAGVSS